MQWTADVTVGDWLRDRIDDPWHGTIHDVVPRGFASYTRIFHGASKSRPVNDAWPDLPYEANRRAWEAFGERQPEIETVAARWSDAADAFGTTMHGEVQWGALVRAPGTEWDPNGWQQANAPDGWQFDAPQEGQLDSNLVSVVAAIAAGHTNTPDDAFVGVWEGWGGLVGAMGWGQSRTFFTIGGDAGEADAASARHTDFLASTGRDVFNNVFSQPSWHSGVLSDEISRGARFELPNRDFVLFRSALAELADPDWMLSVPWRDRTKEEHGFAPSAESPSLIWPADQSWVMLSEVDWDSTIVAGPHALAQALYADERLEALGIREDTCLQWDADRVNK